MEIIVISGLFLTIVYIVLNFLGLRPDNTVLRIFFAVVATLSAAMVAAMLKLPDGFVAAVAVAMMGGFIIDELAHKKD